MYLSTRRLFTAILFVALFVMTTREITDPDFWWHLRTGQFIIETQTIPHTDIFSFTNAGKTWVTHEWLAEVFIYALYALGSFPLLTLTFAGILTLTFGLAFARCAGKPYVAALAVLLAALATAPTWGVRPQMLSLLLTSVFLFILDKWQASAHAQRTFLWLLVPLMIVWVNLHSGYALGLVIVAVYLFGEIVQTIGEPRSLSRLATIALVFVLCLAAVPLNPNGATMFVYPFETLTSQAMQAYIQEWFSPDFHLVEWQPFAWLLLGTLAALAFSGKRATLTQIILLVGFGYAGLRSARNIPIFALVAAPVLAEHLWHSIASRNWIAPTPKRLTRGMGIVNWVLLGVIIAAGALRVSMVIENQSASEREKFPAAAVDFLQAQKIFAPLYNAYGWGGYLIWRMYPQTRVFIDGRADVYGDAFIEEFLQAYRGGSDWRAPLDRYGVRVVLIEPDAPLVAQLARDAAWQPVYADKQAVIYTR